MSPALTRSTYIRPKLNLSNAHDGAVIESLPDLLEFNAVNNPDHLFGIQIPGGQDVSSCEITFSQLQTAVEYASSWLVQTGCTTGRTQRLDFVRPVGIMLDGDISIFIYMAALLRIGTPVLLLSARLTPAAIAHLVTKTSPSCILTSTHTSWPSNEAVSLLRAENNISRIPDLTNALGYEGLLYGGHNPSSFVAPSKYTAYEPGDLDALIMHSSGTTGLPKPIYHNQTYLLLYASCHRLPEQVEPFRFHVSTAPLYHALGLSAPSLSLSVGMPVVLPPAGMIPTAKTTLATLQSCGARYLLTVPSIVEEFVRLPRNEGIEALRDLEIVTVGGAPMKDSVAKQIVAAGVNLLNVWGCTELGLLVPIQRVPRGYDWRYITPRTDTGLQLVPLEDGNGYRPIGRPPGWTAPFEVQDLFERNPFDANQYRVMGRTDDLLVLSTGEKVRPSNIERAVSEHPYINAALVFGDGQVALGLLVELADAQSRIDPDHPEDMDPFMTSILPYLERGNALTEKHGKVSPDMIIMTRETTKPFQRTDKGSTARKATLDAFAPEIKACYARSSTHSKAAPFPLPSVDDGRSLLDVIRVLVKEIVEHEISDSADFFEAGMDSLQASRLRKVILNRLRATLGLPNPVDDLEHDFCFENSSVKKIYVALERLMSGTHLETSPLNKTKRVLAMKEMVEKYRDVLKGYSCLVGQVHSARSQVKSSTGSPRNVVLLTGSTGSLGCFLLARLASDPNISQVICLNRHHAETPQKRQMDLMAKRGASMASTAWNKCSFHEVDMGRPDFGLGKDAFEQLLDVTHLIHNAWPVNFSRSLASFETHVHGLCNLVRLALLGSGKRAPGSPPTRILFASSIAVAGRFPLLNPHGPYEVPETALDAENTAEFGYPEAKWVCERVLMAAVEMYGSVYSVEEPLILGSSVRIGQMTGPEKSGVWNESEHIPIVVRASQKIRALPVIQGSLAWMPVNRAGDIMVELLFSKGFKPFYHLENPSRQSWDEVLGHLTSILGGKDTPFPLVPLSDWIGCVRALGDDPSMNIALKILGFLERDFERMASGTVILRTALTREDSLTLVRSTALGNIHLEKYIAYWKSVDAA